MVASDNMHFGSIKSAHEKENIANCVHCSLLNHKWERKKAFFIRLRILVRKSILQKSQHMKTFIKQNTHHTVLLAKTINA